MHTVHQTKSGGVLNSQMLGSKVSSDPIYSAKKKKNAIVITIFKE